jgi:hypothetical protein
LPDSCAAAKNIVIRPLHDLANIDLAELQIAILAVLDQSIQRPAGALPMMASKRIAPGTDRQGGATR